MLDMRSTVDWDIEVATSERQPAVPPAPARLQDTEIEPDVLANLVIKLAHTVPRFSSDWVARKICLPLQLVSELLEQLRRDHLVEVLGQSGVFNHQFAITARGREHAARLRSISGYVGPAPVSLDAYTKCLELQFDSLPRPTNTAIESSLGDMILPEQVRQVAGLAVRARRSLFLYGPPGNGKTTLGHLLHAAVDGNLWIPYCIGVENAVIRVFDRQCHQLVQPSSPRNYDRRWVCIRRPFIVVGGELTLDALDLRHSSSLGSYEAPLHFKANGGTFLLDDFGCQRVEPTKLLNRWIHPLECGIDFLTLRTGQQLEVPFYQTLIVSTNIEPDEVMTPAFLRRIGYRVYLGNPTIQQYSDIFRRYAAMYDLPVSDNLLTWLLARYKSEGRPLRSCEPRDLIERARDLCCYRGQEFELSSETLELAWEGYFGRRPEKDQCEHLTASTL